MVTDTNSKTLEKRLNLLEARQSVQISRIEDLEYKFNIMPFEKHLDEILNYVRTTFRESDFVYAVRYAPLENRVFELTILHEMENRATALERIYDQFSKIKEMFPNMDFKMRQFHRDDIQPDQLVGTKKGFFKNIGINVNTVLYGDYLATGQQQALFYKSYLCINYGIAKTIFHILQ